MAVWSENTRAAIKLCVAAASWTASIVLTIIATVRPSMNERIELWILLSLAIAVTTTLAAIITRAQNEVVEDVTAEHRQAIHSIKS